MRRAPTRTNRSRALALAALLALATGLPAVVAPPGVRAAVVAAPAAQTVRRFDTTEQVIVLTFDAGADRGYASQILDTLTAKRVAASFGMTGTFATANRTGAPFLP